MTNKIYIPFATYRDPDGYLGISSYDAFYTDKDTAIKFLTKEVMKVHKDVSIMEGETPSMWDECADTFTSVYTFRVLYRETNKYSDPYFVREYSLGE